MGGLLIVLFNAFILDLFANPVGYRTSLGNNALPTTLARILLFFTGNCSETGVSEQLYLGHLEEPTEFLEILLFYEQSGGCYEHGYTFQ
jgi:hypothetical protein